MLPSILRWLCFGVLLTCHGTCLLAQEQAPKRTPPIATNGRVEVDEIRIARVRASDASPEADLTNMQVSLWIDMKDAKARGFLVRLVKLEPIVDDTGKILSTEERRRKILPLGKEARVRELKTSRGRHGPVVSLLLDAPSRGALRIKTLKGCIEITPASNEKIVVDNLPSLVGKRIEHALLTELSVVPRIEMNDDSTEVTLEITGRHDRLIDWGVAQDGRPLDPDKQSKSAVDDRVQTVGLGYPGFRPNKNTSLLIAVSKAGMKRLIEFEFFDLELP